jgi:hypothetical protein
VTDWPSIDPDEFRKGGYLQEVNRRVLHPLGLALAVQYDDDGTGTGYVVLDSRDDPEGIYFHPGCDLAPHADRVQAEFDRRAPAREKRLGYVVQPPA